MDSAYVSSLPNKRLALAFRDPSVMSSQPLRPWFAAAARCSSRAQLRTSQNVAVRRLNTWEGQEKQLKEQPEWTQFQLDRSYFKALGMSVLNFILKLILSNACLRQSILSLSMGLPRRVKTRSNHITPFTDQCHQRMLPYPR